MQVHAQIATQVAYDLHLAPMLLERALDDDPLDDVTDLMERLEMIHRTMQRIAEDRAKAKAEAETH